jgi:glucose/arabinose dehydrogenase
MWVADSPNGETGCLGLAFHPHYAQNGYFYVTYTAGKASAPGVYFQRLSRFTVPAEQRNLPLPVADPNSELILIEQPDREDNHNGGDIHFGADGYLYYAIGDEGNPNDHLGNSQRIDGNFFGAMLRIDVDKKLGNL